MTLARRMALLDLGWEDADAIVVGLTRDDVEVRLVLGAEPDEPGLRVARLLGVPHSTDLVDLTRELFDLAVIGASSRRRAALERLLESLGASVVDLTPGAGAARPPIANGSSGRPGEGPIGSTDVMDLDLASWGEAWGGGVDVVLPAATPLGDPGDRAPSAGGAEPGVATAGGARRVTPEELARRADLALERHRAEGTRATIHRLTLAPDAAQDPGLAHALPEAFRAMDVVCRIDGSTWVLLCTGPIAPGFPIERRVHAARSRAPGGPAVSVTGHERVALASEADAAAFAAAARAWTAGPVEHGPPDR